MPLAIAIAILFFLFAGPKRSGFDFPTPSKKEVVLFCLLFLVMFVTCWVGLEWLIATSSVT